MIISQTLDGTKLTQRQWSDLVAAMDVYYLIYGKDRVGRWTSDGEATTRSGCWMFEPWDHLVDEMHEKMNNLGLKFNVTIWMAEASVLLPHGPLPIVAGTT